MPRPFALAALLALLATSTGSASTIYATDAPLTGSRSNLVAGGNYSGATLTVNWTITPNADGTFTYTYEFIGFRMPGISHVILDLTDDAVGQGPGPADPLAVTGTTYDGSPEDVSLEFRSFGPSPSNPGFPADHPIVGVKFDDTVGTNPMVIRFTSNRAPVYGDIYIKGGSNSFAYNPGLVDHASTDPLAFIARPNGVVPEPSTFALCSIAALAGLGLASRRLRRRG